MEERANEYWDMVDKISEVREKKNHTWPTQCWDVG